ncbi:AraC family transcriptional regulator, partial [Acinetobacter baumannii]|nr:AraC family transcriptional regulator [Acinetobacter baumannii]
MIYGQPNNALHKIDYYKEKTVSPYFVKRTEAYIKEH